LLAPVVSGESWTFDQFMSKFQKSYPDKATLERHRQTFEMNLALVENQPADASFQIGINQFSDLTPQEFEKLFLGRKGGKSLDREGEIRSSLKVGAPLPPSIDWRTKNVISPVKNQGGCGSCWAFGSTEQVESYVALSGAALPILSPQELVSCDKNPQHCGGTGGCEGSIPELAFDYVKQSGLALEKDYPYLGRDSPCNTTQASKSAASITGYVKLVQNDYDSVMTALATIGPLAVNVWAMPFQSYRSGVFNGCNYKMNMDIDHVMQLVGYGTDAGKDYWIVRNSWGSSWGENGYIRLAREKQSLNTCGIDMSPADGTGCDGDPAVIGVCGQCGILWDVSYPTGAKAV
jgi:cathepsin L